MKQPVDSFEVSSVLVGDGLGRIGICACPGRSFPPVIGGGLHRDMEADLGVIRDFGAAALVSLMEAGEKEWAGAPLARWRARVAAHGMQALHLPITDGEAPDARWEQLWQSAGPALHGYLRQQRNVVVHCRGGRGRAGLVAARLLIGFGEAPDAAIARVRAARPGAIETRAQEDYLRSRHVLL